MQRIYLISSVFLGNLSRIVARGLFRINASIWKIDLLENPRLLVTHKSSILHMWDVQAIARGLYLFIMALCVFNRNGRL